MKIMLRTVILLLVASISLFVLAIPVSNLILNNYRTEILGAISQSIGREVEIDGSLRLAFSLPLALHAGEVSIGNPPWTSNPGFLMAESVDVDFDLVSLFAKRINIEHLRIDGAELHLEEAASGDNNWSFSAGDKPQVGDDSSWQFEDIQTIGINDARVQFKTVSSKTELEIIKADVAHTSDKPVNIKLQGKLNNDYLELNADISSLNELLDPKTDKLPVKGKIQIADTVLEADATLTFPIGSNWSARVKVTGPNNATLSKLLSIQLIPTQAFQLSANIEKQEANIVFDDINGYFDDVESIGPISLKSGKIRLGQSSTEVQLSGEVNSQPYIVNITGGSMEKLFSLEGEWPIESESEYAGSTFNTTGVIEFKKGIAIFVAKHSAMIKNPENLWGELPYSLTRLFPLNISGDLRVTPTELKFTHLNIKNDHNEINGKLSIENIDTKPSIKVSVSAKQLDLIPVAKTVSDKTKGNKAKGSKLNLEDLWSTPIFWTLSKNLDASIKLDFGKIILPKVSLKKVKTNAAIKNGTLTISSASARLFDEEFKLNGTMSTVEKGLSVDVALSATTLKLKDWLKLFSVESTIAVEVGQADLKFKSTARTPVKLFEDASISLSTRNISIDSTTMQSKAGGITLQQLNLETRNGGNLKVNATGLFLEETFKLKGTLGRVLTWAANKGRLTINLEAQVAELIAQTNGHIGLPLNKRTANLNIKIFGDEIGNFSRISQKTVPPLGKFELKGGLTSNKQLYEIKDVSGHIQNKGVSGSISYDDSGDIAYLKAVVKLAHVDISSWLAERLAKNKKPLKPEKAVEQERKLPDLTELDDLDFKLDFEIARISHGEHDLGDFRLKASLLKGILNVDPLHSTLSGGGTINGTFNINGPDNPDGASVTFSAEDINYGELLKRLELTSIASGKFNFYFDAKSSGYTARELLKNAKGSLSTYGGEGYFGTSALRATLNLQNIVSGMTPKFFQKEERANLECFAMQADLSEGLLYTDSALLEGPNLSVGMTGSYELLTEQVHLLISPNKKRLSIFEVAVPVNVEGTPKNLSVTPGALPSVKVLGVLNLDLSKPGRLLGLLQPVEDILAQNGKKHKDDNFCVVTLAYQDYKEENKDAKRPSLKKLRNNIEEIETNDFDIRCSHDSCNSASEQ